MTVETTVVSFVVRFVYDAPADGPAGLASDWHGFIRHVQSDEERHFTRWEDAASFMAQYVRLENGPDVTVA